MQIPAEQKAQPASDTPAPAPPRHRRGLLSDVDILSGLAFIGAGAFGIVKIANDIRDRFFTVFVKAYDTGNTRFAAIIDKYEAPTTGEFAKVVQELGDKPREYEAAMTKTARAYRSEINNKLLQDHGIHTNGLRGWTQGTWQRFTRMGPGARHAASLGFASVAAVAAGAVLVLRNSRNIIEHIDDKLDGLQEHSQQR